MKLELKSVGRILMTGFSKRGMQPTKTTCQASLFQQVIQRNLLPMPFLYDAMLSTLHQKVFFRNCIEFIYSHQNNHMEFQIAILNKNYDQAAKYINSGSINIDARNEKQMTPLMEFTQRGILKMVKLLIKKGAKIDLQDIHGYSALMWALDRCYYNIARYLIESGANLNLTDKKGDSALDTALVLISGKKRFKFAKWLISQPSITQDIKIHAIESLKKNIDELKIELLKYKEELNKLNEDYNSKKISKDEYTKKKEDAIQEQETYSEYIKLQTQFLTECCGV